MTNFLAPSLDTVQFDEAAWTSLVRFGDLGNRVGRDSPDLGVEIGVVVERLVQVIQQVSRHVEERNAVEHAVGQRIGALIDAAHDDFAGQVVGVDLHRRSDEQLRRGSEDRGPAHRDIADLTDQGLERQATLITARTPVPAPDVPVEPESRRGGACAQSTRGIGRMGHLLISAPVDRW